ncbi:MAG: carbohydrate-binding protein [Oscillospiraceae bacterium]
MSGKPGESGSECLGEFTYQADFIWQTYQDNSYVLPRKLTGVHDIYFEFDKTDLRIDFGGFKFEPKLKAYEKLNASDCDLIHGDSYEISGGRITGIGNNVFIDFEDMDFAKGVSEVRLTGKTHHDNDSIHLHLADETGVVLKEIIEFPHSEDYTTVSVKLPSVQGKMTVKLQFLPGCAFDFESIEFIQQE